MRLFPINYSEFLKRMSAMKLPLLSLFFAPLLLVLAACGDSVSNPTSGNRSSGEQDLPQGLVIEQFATDASTVQAAAPPTNGKSEPGTPLGLLSYYEGSTPTRLVVFAHGLGHDVVKSWTQYIVRTTREDVATVTTNYRDNLQMPVLRGAHDIIAATLYARERFPTVETVYFLGVSLGGAISGTAIAESLHVIEPGESLFDYWVALEPLTNLIEAYAEASGAVPEYAAFMEDENGGTAMEQPQEYQRRSPATRAAEMAEAGIRAVAIIHPVNDGLVVYNQAREMASALVSVGIPTQLTTVLRHEEGQDPGTEGSGVIAGSAGVDDPNSELRMAGHADEADATHPVMRRGFEILEELLDGVYDETIPYMEHVLDDG